MLISDAKQLLKGAATYIPGLYQLATPRGKHSGGTDKAAYCYEVWMKHLTLLGANGLGAMPVALAELGPGGSLGVGAAALLSGVERYYALDLIEFADVSRNLMIFDQLVEMFRSRAPRPSKGWPDYDRYLDTNLFPSHILTDDILNRSLAEDRVGRIRQALSAPGTQVGDILISYEAPWQSAATIQPGTVDLVLSHTVLECVDDLELIYRACALWLKPSGWISHQMGYSSIGYSRKWNGHWAYSEPMWALAVGKRPYATNRQPHSAHVRLMQKYGFDVVSELKAYRENGIRRSQLASRWTELSDDDFACFASFIQAVNGRAPGVGSDVDG